MSQIKGYFELDVYKESYQGMLEVYKKVLPRLPTIERDLIDQLRRSCKAVPRLIAEGHSKRHQKRGFQKYIDDALAEANETIVSLSQAKDLYPKLVDIKVMDELIKRYDIVCRRLYRLALAWQKFHERKPDYSRLSTIPAPQSCDKRLME